MIYSKIKNRGFSLVETLVYAAGTVFLIALIVSALFYAYRWYDANIVPSRIDSIGQSLANRLTIELRSAVSFNPAQSAFDIADGAISITAKVNATTTMTKRFFLQGGRIAYQEESQPISFLTPDNVTFSKFLLSKATTTISTGIKFGFDISYPTRNGVATGSYSGYAIFRNSYK